MPLQSHHQILFICETVEHIILRFYYYLFQSQSTELPVPSFWSLVQLLLFIFNISHELEKKH